MTQYRQDVVGRQTPPAAALNRNKRARPLAFDTVAEMRADTFVDSDGNAIADGEAVELMGYHARNDDGGGLFVVDRTDTTSLDDGGLVIVTTAGVRLKRVRSTDYTLPEWWGAYGDGVIDDSIALQAAMTEGVCLLGAKTYLTSVELTPSGGGVIGVGMTRSVIKVADNAVYDLVDQKFNVLDGDNLDGVRVARLTVDCNFDNQGTLPNGRVCNTIAAIRLTGSGLLVDGVETINFGVGDGTDTDNELFVVGLGGVTAADVGPLEIRDCVAHTAGANALQNETAVGITVFACEDQDTRDFTTPSNAYGNRPCRIVNSSVKNIDLSTVSGTSAIHGFLGTFVEGNYMTDVAADIVRGFYKDSWAVQSVHVVGNLFEGITQGIVLGFQDGLNMNVEDLWIANNTIVFHPTDYGVGIYLLAQAAAVAHIRRGHIVHNHIKGFGGGQVGITVQFTYGIVSTVGQVEIAHNLIDGGDNAKIQVSAASAANLASLVEARYGDQPQLHIHSNLDGNNDLARYLVNDSSGFRDVVPAEDQQTAVGLSRDQVFRAFAGATGATNPYPTIGRPLFIGERVRNTTNGRWWMGVAQGGAVTDWEPVEKGPCSATPTLLDATDDIPCGAPMILIQGNGGPITLTSDPCVESATAIGQELQIVGSGNVWTLTIPHQAGRVNLAGGANYQLDQMDSLRLVWTGSGNFGWVETARSP